MRKKPIWYGDFETTQPNEKGKVRVYLWALVKNDKYRANYGYDLESFLNYILNKRAIIYFHNLKFDSSYILYYFIKHKIKFDISEKNGVIYSIKFNDIELRDSLNFLPMTLENVGKTYCKTYNKLHYEDYLKPYNYKPNKYDIKYCCYDVYTLKEGLTTYLEELKNVLKENGAPNTAKKVSRKITNAGIAYEAFKEITNIEKICERTTREMFDILRPSYSGGFVYAKGGTYEATAETPIIMIDENSMYPDKYANYPMPIGRAIPITSEDDIFNGFAVINITIRYKLKKGYIPIISQGFNKYGGTNYKEFSEDYETMTITSEDFRFILIFYECDYSFNYGFRWNTKSGVFKKYADVFMELKARSTGVRREIAKKLLNMCYGKTAMSGINEKKKYYIDSEEDVVRSSILEYEEDDTQLQYFHIGIAICAYARADLFSNMLLIGCENVLYTDTDSIKFLLKDESILNKLKLDDKKLGYWKIEGKPELFKPLAPKKYIYYENNRIKVTSAGFPHNSVFEALNCPYYKNDKGEYESLPMPKNDAIGFIAKFDFGLQVKCKQSKMVEGGRLISEITKEIKKPKRDL